MRIVINALPAIVGAGVTFYNNFLPELAAVDTGHEYVVLLYEGQEKVLTGIPEKFERKVVNAPRGYALRFLWEQLWLPVLLRRWRADVLYTQGNVTSILTSARTVVVITGANPYSSLGLARSSERLKNAAQRFFSRVSASRASRVLFISDDSRRKISRILGVKDEKTAVVYYGWRPTDRAPGSRFNDLGDYVLTVSVLWEHKNLERLLLAFDRLVSMTGYSGKLVIAGTPHRPDYYARLRALSDSLTAKQQVMFTERVEDGDLAELYRRCRIFVFPSVEETLGLPLLEAMGYGAAAVVSDAELTGNGERFFSPFREIAGDAAAYFNPFDVDAIANAMAAAMRDEARLAEMKRLGLEAVKKFSWRRTAEQTVVVFDSLAREMR